MSNQLLTGKIAIVTGAGRGIGHAIALTLAGQRAAVVLAARSENELQEAAAQIESAGGKAICVPTDVSDESQVKHLIERTIDEYGQLDILINNAGMGMFGPMVEMTTAQWDEIFAVNTRGTFILCREAIAHLAKQEVSYIVNIASVVAVKGYIHQSAYAASKHAMLGMSKTLAKEVQPDNIRVHAVNPGGVATELVQKARPDLDMSVLMQPQDIADIVEFLVTRKGNAVIDQIDVRRVSSTPWA
jgi:3-oxoacyl-[acyl-carrier protein] reductase